MKKVFALCILLSSLSGKAFAGIEISEIMYDLKTGSDDGREWVEVYNNSAETVNFSDYKFFEANTNHKLTLAMGSAEISPQGYAIIVSDLVKFKTDWPNISSSIFDSTFSLNNSGEILAIKNSESIVDTYSYTSSSGGAGDGKSLQKINEAWVSAMPTPGTLNKISYTSPNVPAKKEVVVPKNAPLTTAEIEQEENAQLKNLPPAPKLDIEEEVEAARDNTSLFFAIFVVLLGAGASGVYFLRKKKKIEQNYEDFEILE